LVVPTRAHDELPADPGLLKRVVQENRWALGPFGRPGCPGAYAEVERPGRFTVCDRLTTTAATHQTAEDAVAATLKRVATTLADDPA